MSSSTAPKVPEGPGESTQANEPTVNPKSDTEIQIEASTKYWKAVGSQAARRILKTTEKDAEILNEPTLMTLEDPKGLGTNLTQPGTDLQLIEALFFSFAKTRSKLIASALKRSKGVEVPDIMDLPEDLQDAGFKDFFLKIYENHPKVEAAIIDACNQDRTFLPTLAASRAPGNSTILQLKWITDIDLAMRKVLHYHMDRIDEYFSEHFSEHFSEYYIGFGEVHDDMREVNSQYEMACYAVEHGCRVLDNISSGHGDRNMVDSAVRGMNLATPIIQEDEEAYVAREEYAKWRKEHAVAEAMNCGEEAMD